MLEEGTGDGVREGNGKEEERKEDRGDRENGVRELVPLEHG